MARQGLPRRRPMEVEVPVKASLERQRQAALRRAEATEARQRRVEDAVEILGPESRRDVERSARFIDGMAAKLAARSVSQKATKIAARRVANKLKRLEVALKDRHLEPFVRDYFPMADLRQWQAHCEAVARAKLGKPARRDGEIKRVSAGEAAFLLERHSLPLNVTREGKFVRLAEVLYGHERADLFEFCRAVKADRNRG